MEENTIQENITMPVVTNKIYATVDERGIVKKLFSSVFEEPKEGDIMVDEGNEDYHAHVHLKYKLFDDNGKFKYKVVDGKLVERTAEEKVDINEIRFNKSTEIERKCGQVITGGFKSSAYQKIEKTYDTSLESQANITGNALSATSKMAGVPECQNDKFYYHASGEDFAEWTADECLQLARDFKTFKETQLLKSKALQTYIENLTDVDKIKAITWETEIPTTTA